MEKISAVYKITNTATGDFYIGSSKDVKLRWMQHKRQSVWKKCVNNQMYLDMKRYGIDKFEMQILAEVEIEQLKEEEQQFIEKLQPTYNNNNAKGWNTERYDEYQKEYYQQNRKIRNEYQKEYYQQNRKIRNEYQKEYNNQICSYNGETITLNALRMRFVKAGISHPAQEAKKYLIGVNND